MIWFLVALGAVLLNAVPAFMPPTWAFLAWVHLQYELPVVALAFVGALGSGAGRMLLALGSRSFGHRFVPRRWESNIQALTLRLEEHPTAGLSLVALFMLGPIPSNHLFIAAGMGNAPLAPLIGLFCAARFLSYLIWITATTAFTRSLTEVLSPVAGGWAAVAVQVGGILILIGLMQIDWGRLLGRPGGWPVASVADREAAPPAQPD